MMRQKYRNIWTSMLMVIILTLGLAAAWNFPGFYNAYYDEKNMAERKFQNVEVEAYSYSYESVLEKLEELSYFSENGIQVVPIPLPEMENQEKLSAEMKNKAQEELDKLVKLKILPEKINVEEYEVNYLERYQIYPVSVEQFRGEISYWSLNLYNDSSSITLYMDTEFYKIYSLEIWGEYMESWANITEEILNKESYDAAEKVMDTIYSFSNSWCQYYGLSHSEEALKDMGESTLYGESLMASVYDLMSMVYEGVKIQSEVYAPGYIAGDELDSVIPVHVYYYAKGIAMKVGADW